MKDMQERFEAWINILIYSKVSVVKERAET